MLQQPLQSIYAHNTFGICMYVYNATALPLFDSSPSQRPVMLSSCFRSPSSSAHTPHIPIWRRSKGHCLNGSAPVMDRKTHAFIAHTMMVSPSSPEPARVRDKTLANVDGKESRETVRPASRSPHGPVTENLYIYTF